MTSTTDVQQKRRERSNSSASTSRGRSPGPVGTSHSASDASISTQTRSNKRRKRSELSPSSKATHSFIEKERREAMNERFSELAALVPDLRSAIEKGKKPTKGDIVKASINYHLEQEDRIRLLSKQLGELEARFGVSPTVPVNGALAAMQSNTTSTTPTSAPVAPAQVPDAPQTSWFTGNLEQVASKNQAPAPGPTPVAITSTDQTSPYSDHIQATAAPTWDASSVQSWLATEGTGMMPLDLSSHLFDAQSLVHQQPTSTFSSPTFGTWQSDSSFSDVGDQSMVTQRSFSEADASAIAFFTSQLGMDQTATGEVSRTYTYQAEPMTLFSQMSGGGNVESQTEELGLNEILSSFALDKSSLDGSNSGSQVTVKGSNETAQSAAYAVAGSPHEAAKAFPTLLSTDKPTKVSC